MTDANTRRDRYPGARPFADDPVDQRLFFGRPQEAEELFHRITAEPLLVVYGKSGLGKTSLLQAGVFPRLRERDLLPVPIRLNRPAVTPLAAVREALQQACLAEGIDYEPDDAPELWTLFKTAVLWRGDALQTSVLVLDQFEEFFTLQETAGRRRWAGALGDLLGGRVPEPVRARIRAGERLPFGEGPPAVKVVLSLREDHLGGLEELAGELPDVLERRFRLTALDRDAARAAIVEPGLARGEDLASPPLRFSDGALMELLEFLEGRSGIIEPFQLQVLCRHLEQQGAHHAKGTGEITIDRTNLGGREDMEAVLGNFYRNAITALPRRSNRQHARKLCEWGLLSGEGRRLLMEQSEIQRRFRLGPDALLRLVDARLLRSEPRLESVFYELSHDTLAEAVLKHRRRPYLRWAIALLLPSIIVAAGGTVWVTYKTTTLINVEQTRSKLQQSVETNYEREFMAASAVNDRAMRELLQQTAKAQRDFQLARIDNLLTDFSDSAYTDEATGIYKELIRILQERGTSEALAYMEHQIPGTMGNVDGIAEDAETLIRTRLNPLLISAELYRVEGNAQAARNLYAQILERASDWPAALHDNVNFLIEQGDQAVIRGSLLDAEQDFLEAQARSEHLLKLEPDNPEWQRDLAVSLERVGDVNSAQGDLAGARIAYEQSQAIRERLAVADPSNAGWQRDLAESLGKVGDIEAAQGDLEGALKRYEQSLAIVRRLGASDPNNAGWQRELSVSLNKVGDIKFAQGDLAGVLAAYKQSQDIRKRLAAADPSNAGWQRDLSVSLEKVGDVKAAQGDLDGALAAYPSNAGWQRDLSVSLEKIGNVKADQGDLDGALAAYQQSQDIRERLAGADLSNARWQRDLAVSHYKLGTIADARGDQQALARHWGAMLAIFDTLDEAELHISPSDRMELETIRARVDRAAAAAPKQDTPLPSSGGD
ncbi:tetratricopeptide repeat protein [Rhabdochromatium marinum]|uniref:nSTAND1 domain-containing NTPase n=1 Tax=Rhabdochromatium marinum TaxID=48729 RepID=UPI00190750A2|nr:tetratricopeptide repeat protein [Rhabdochromatium marinum]MBK1648556.1 hypothetical protein [Rhabdochromatium marinum]